MKKQLPHRTTLRFRQWSRKGYAIFASLGVCTTIGRLRKNVTECALRKQPSHCANPVSLESWREEQSFSETDEPLTGSPQESLLFTTLLPQLITENSCTAAKQSGFTTCIIYKKEVVFTRVKAASFYLPETKHRTL